MPAAKHLLLVEDDPDIAKILADNLREEGYRVEVIADGDAALAAIAANHYDMLLLDVMLPGVDGLEICRQVRARQVYTPIIIVSSKSSDVQRVVGLEIGADDYITKPFSLAELVARVRALLRRATALNRPNAEQSTTVIVTQGLRIDAQNRTVVLDSQSVALTAREFDLLNFFARHPGRMLSRLELLNQVWGYSHDGYEHTVNSHINRLRAKIEADPANPTRILTVWGLGYKFAGPEDSVE
ncbi:response regulator transcription factor [Methylomonas rosea]|uniref:Response regulator transcription factor n=1 Tax=Methylomonas rosea TaxID=2952227 RepID=A0ABT1TSS4_9GAMM|nr:response regulator transcription factor [Methylomonas sp. WSC-7]MCQ8117824.1 response regulator transcription factor [Methylomonas sp. WSC-7]